MSFLESLDLTRLAFFDEELALIIAANRRLQTLRLAHCRRITGACFFADMSTTSALRELFLYHSGIDDDGLRHLSRLQHVETVDLGNTAITDVGLSHVGRMTGLVNVNLGGCTAITDAGLQHIAQLPDVKKLNLGHTNLTDIGLGYFATTRTLEELDVLACGVTDAGVGALVALPRLRKLFINRCTSLTPAVLPHLARLAPLKQVTLSGDDARMIAAVNKLGAPFALKVRWE